MLKLVYLQAACALIGVLAGAAMAGLRGAISAALAGMVCVVPSLLLASNLLIAARRPGGVQAMRLLVGEGVKILVTIVLLVMLPWVYPDLAWGAVVVGLMTTLQANFLIFLVKP